MSDRIRIRKENGTWLTASGDQEQPHPTFELAMRHAQHLLTPPTPARKRIAQDPERLAHQRFRRAMKRAARQEGEVA